MTPGSRARGTSHTRRVASVVFAASSAILASGCAHQLSFERAQIFVGRYQSGSAYVFNAVDVRANGSFRTWNSMCLRQAGESGIWKPDGERCIRLLTQTNPCRICSPEDMHLAELIGELIGLRCCLDDEDRKALVSSEWGKLCVADDGALHEVHVDPWNEQTYDQAYVRVEGYPGATPERTAAPFDVYAYKLAGACERDGDRVSCDCATNRDLATLERASLTARLHVEAVEPLHLESLRGHELTELQLVDPSLTSLAHLPASDHLRVLDVDAPLRALGDLRRFPALEELTLSRTHLTRLDALAGLSLTRLRIASMHALDLAPLGALPRLEALFVESADATSLEAIARAPKLVELGFFDAPKWPLLDRAHDFSGLGHPGVRTLALAARDSSALTPLLRGDVRASFPALTVLEIPGQSSFATEEAKVAAGRSDDYVPPPGVRVVGISTDTYGMGPRSMCASMAGDALDRCGWSDACFTRGLCSAAGKGACRAGDDADCVQSVACFDEGRCHAREGVCVAR